MCIGVPEALASHAVGSQFGSRISRQGRAGGVPHRMAHHSPLPARASWGLCAQFRSSCAVVGQGAGWAGASMAPEAPPLAMAGRLALWHLLRWQTLDPPPARSLAVPCIMAAPCLVLSREHACLSEQSGALCKAQQQTGTSNASGRSSLAQTQRNRCACARCPWLGLFATRPCGACLTSPTNRHAPSPVPSMGVPNTGGAVKKKVKVPHNRMV